MERGREGVNDARLVRLRSILAIAAIWILWALWSRLNFPAGIQLLSWVSLVIGIPATVLGLLPSSEKDGWRSGVTSRLHDRLADPRVARALALAAGAIAIAGTLVSSVRVESTKGVPARITVIDGSQSRPDSIAADSIMLGVGYDQSVDVRLTPVWHGRRWARTGSYVSQRDASALPWRPATWRFPDDFDEIVTLFVLPTTAANSAIRSSAGALELVVLGTAGDTIVHGPLERSGARIEFIARSLHRDSLAATWTRAYREHLAPRWNSAASDSLALYGMLAMSDTALRTALLQQQDSIAQRLSVVPRQVETWLGARRTRGVRPLHRGETVRFHFADERGPIAAPVEVTLDRTPYPLLVEASHVNRPTVTPP
jgi:hypothetical protein